MLPLPLSRSVRTGTEIVRSRRALLGVGIFYRMSFSLAVFLSTTASITANCHHGHHFQNSSLLQLIIINPRDGGHKTDKCSI